jgi:hypothetical protein
MTCTRGLPAPAARYIVHIPSLSGRNCFCGLPPLCARWVAHAEKKSNLRGISNGTGIRSGIVIGTR